MTNVLILDNDTVYGQKISNGLNEFFRAKSIRSPIHVTCADDITEISMEDTIVLYNPDQFCNLPPYSCTALLIENSTEATTKDEQLYKYASVYEMSGFIERLCKKAGHEEPAYQRESVLTVIGSACPELRHCEIERIRRDKLEEGFKVIQIDFCPPYMRYTGRQDIESTGFTLSDALLRIMSNDFPVEDFGKYLVIGEDGSYFFRGVERSDDLFECNPSHIREFFTTTQKWLSSRENEYFVIFNCISIPFSLIYTFVVLSDRVLLASSSSHPDAASLYNMEISYLLANLPTSCHVEEVFLRCAHA